MKKGIILCIDEKVPAPWTWNHEVNLREKLENYDCVRFITPHILPYQLQYTWLDMLTKGIMNIEVAPVTQFLFKCSRLAEPVYG